MSFIFIMYQAANMHEIFNIFHLAHVSLLYKFFIIGVSPILIFKFVPSAKQAFVTSPVRGFQNKNTFKLLWSMNVFFKIHDLMDKSVHMLKILLRSIKKGLKTKKTQSSLWIRIKLFQLVCPVTIGQSVLAIVVLIGYVQILGIILNTGVADCVPPSQEDLQKKVEIIYENDILDLNAATIFSTLKPENHKDMRDIFEYMPGYEAVGYDFPWGTMSSLNTHMGNQGFKYILNAALNGPRGQVILYGSALNYHIIERLTTLIDAQDVATRQWVLKDIIFHLPYYLEFQLPLAKLFCQSVGYEPPDFFFNTSVLARFDSNFNFNGNMTGRLYHDHPFGINDPYHPSGRVNVKVIKIYLEFSKTMSEIVVIKPSTSFALPEVQQESVNVRLENQPSIRSEIPESVASPLLDVTNSKKNEAGLTLSKCKNVFLQKELLQLKITKANLQHEYHCNLMLGGVSTVVIGYGIYTISTIF